LESDHRNPEKKSTRGNTEPEREKKKDVASTALRRKGTVIHR
jgi:hypothetical protein